MLCSFSLACWQILAMVIIGIGYYPLFACMAADYKITGLVIGFLYSAMWLVFFDVSSLLIVSYAAVFWGSVASHPKKRLRRRLIYWPCTIQCQRK